MCVNEQVLFHTETPGALPSHELHLFLLQYHKKSYHNMGTRIKTLFSTLLSARAVAHTLLCTNPLSTQVDGACHSNIDLAGDIQPAVVLAAHIFCLEVHHNRGNKNEKLGPVHGMCGDPEDVTPLELGWMTETHQYSLEPAYKAISKVLAQAILAWSSFIDWLLLPLETD